MLDVTNESVVRDDYYAEGGPLAKWQAEFEDLKLQAGLRGLDEHFEGQIVLNMISALEKAEVEANYSGFVIIEKGLVRVRKSLMELVCSFGEQELTGPLCCDREQAGP